MPGLFRRAVGRHASDAPASKMKRSSSLPPEETAAASSSARGRSANPIGTSRRNRSFYDGRTDHDASGAGAAGGGVGGGGGGYRTQRSQSLTRDNGSLRGSLKKSNSFHSVGSVGSDIQEPMWFAHAFHGSGACTCGRDHAGDNCSRAGDVNNKEGEGEDGSLSSHEDDENFDPHSDEDRFGGNEDEHREDEGEMKRVDSYGGTATEATAGESVTSGSCNDSAGTHDSSKGGGHDSHMSGGGHSNGASSPTSGGQTRDQRAREQPREHTQDASRDNDEQSHRSSFTAQGRSIHSDIVNGRHGDGDDDDDESSAHPSSSHLSTVEGSIQSELLAEGSKDSSLPSYAPKSARGSNNGSKPHGKHGSKHGGHDHNDVSSLTMDSHSTSRSKGKSKSFVSNVKKGTQSAVNKIKKKSRSFHNSHEDFDRSEGSMLSVESGASAATTESDRSRRRRGRSLGLRRKKKEEPSRGSSSNPHPYTRRRSRSDADVDGGGEDDKRVRERSRSIVRDARSFLESIDGSSRSHGSHGEGESLQTEESRSVTSASSTIVTGSSHTGMSSSRGGGGGGGAFLRNKYREERTLRELQDSVHSDDASSDPQSVDASERRRSAKTMELVASLQETNAQNEETIQTLQRQLTDLTNERNAFRNNGERMMEVMTKQKSQLEKELRKERKGFADASHGHKKELEEWTRRAWDAERKAMEVEGKLQERERKWKAREEEMGMMKLREVRDARERRGSDEADMEAIEGPLEGEAGALASELGIDVASPISGKLRRALLRLSDMEAKFTSQVDELRSDKEGMREQVDEWQGRHDELNRKHQDLLDEREEEAALVNALENKLEGCRIAIESMKKAEEAKESSDVGLDGSESSKAGEVNDELVTKIGELADENGRLAVQCQKLEREHASTKASMEASLHDLTQELVSTKAKAEEDAATVQTLEVENRNLRISLAGQGKTSKKMQSLVANLRSSLNSGDAPAAPLAVDVEEREDGSRCSSPLAEMGHGEALATIQDMQNENDALHESMEEAVRLASEMNSKMARFVQEQDASAKENEAKLADLKSDLSKAVALKEEAEYTLGALRKENEKLASELDEANRLVVCSLSDEIKQEQLSQSAWNREKRELSSAMDALKRENEKLHKSMQEMTDLVKTAEECMGKLSGENSGLKEAQEYYEQQLQELKVEREANSYLREEIKKVSTEREEAYGACKVLQHEIDQLRKSAEEAKGQMELLNSDRSLGSMLSDYDKKRLTELAGANESLTKELDQKNEALQAVQGALESLKAEQTTIRDTIEELRTENAKLRDGGDASVPLSSAQDPSQPKSILKRKPNEGGSDSSTIHSLEKRIKKVEKENKGLREANTTLSAKLFDEMEKTDALRVANEGLAARICKLVAFIQQNPNGGDQGSTSTSSNQGGGSSTKKSGGSAKKGGSSRRRSKSPSGGSSRKRSKSPARPKKKKEANR